ncbi:zf-HC2 domain-containing protein [Streptomyces sp. NY05-11A]|uniref:zf-HC2 domain-containing protein n=1 Tax=Streptomyces soliscabiei TaxID=588897 RepID=UPI0029B84C42|nr:zf-HC2 domain-containing protein [Streptomyces sp. NY05-11A]MDX2679509.1 zf-HC2 domain-containing protein [Streptomyces sp. NY05-11A]
MSTAENWHTSDDLAARYADGTLPEADAWSLEKHLERCGACAARVSAAVRRVPTAGVVLAEVREAVLREVAPREAVRREAVLAEVREAGPVAAPQASARAHSVLWAAGPAVRGAWLPALLLVALGALALSYGAGVDGAWPVLLALAPVVPVAGVALSYGAHADPLHEIAAATPSGGLRLMLTRTAAVLVVSLPLLTLTGLLLPASGAPGAAAWLLPGLALTLASLALAGWVGCRAATAVTGGGWLCAVLVPALTASGGPALAGLAEQLDRCLGGPPAQVAWGAAAVLCAALLAARRSAYDHLETS